MVARLLAAAAACAACSGKPRTEEVAPPAVGDAAGPVVAAPPDAAARGPGDLQITVEWPDVPIAARSSPGRTPCNTPRAPSVAPTTTWGVPDALVLVDGATAAATAHITLADCALAPRIAVGATLAITSAVDHPAKLLLRRRVTIAALAPGASGSAGSSGAAPQLATGEPVPIQLPIAGHTATISLDAGAIYSLETDAAEPEVAFIAAAPTGFATDAAGRIVVHDLAAGPHAITAWLPPRAGQPARLGRAIATVVAGELTELTVPLAP